MDASPEGTYVRKGSLCDHARHRVKVIVTPAMSTIISKFVFTISLSRIALITREEDPNFEIELAVPDDVRGSNGTFVFALQDDKLIVV
jgi:hypothetical protein